MRWLFAVTPQLDTPALQLDGDRQGQNLAYRMHVSVERPLQESCFLRAIRILGAVPARIKCDTLLWKQPLSSRDIRNRVPTCKSLSSSSLVLGIHAGRNYDLQMVTRAVRPWWTPSCGNQQHSFRTGPGIECHDTQAPAPRIPHALVRLEPGPISANTEDTCRVGKPPPHRSCIGGVLVEIWTC